MIEYPSCSLPITKWMPPSRGPSYHDLCGPYDPFWIGPGKDVRPDLNGLGPLGVISEGHVRPLISLGDDKLMLELFKKILKENSTVRQTEDMARKVKGENEAKAPKKTDKLWVPELDEMAKNVKEKV